MDTQGTKIVIPCFTGYCCFIDDLLKFTALDLNLSRSTKTRTPPCLINDLEYRIDVSALNLRQQHRRFKTRLQALTCQQMSEKQNRFNWGKKRKNFFFLFGSCIFFHNMHDELKFQMHTSCSITCDKERCYNSFFKFSHSRHKCLPSTLGSEIQKTFM